MIPLARPSTLVAIGASAGGPAALAAVLARLPATFAAPVVIVQHLDAQFASGLATWLGDATRLAVRIAADGEVLTPGCVLLAGRDDHLVLKSNRRVGYQTEPAAAIYRPSIDVFFEGVAATWPGPVIGVLLTGMGRDGAAGLKALRDRGHLTLAQDQATSAVYGMPKAAVQLNAAAEVLPLDQIGPRLCQLVP
jgi:two-component system response regulator WspF